MPVSAERRKPLTRVAVTILRYGRLEAGRTLDKQWVLSEAQADIPDGTYRGHAKQLGGRQKRDNQQLRFFSTTRKSIAFGPGAGLALGISIGTSSLRAELVDANGWEYHAREAERDPEQLALPPARLFKRIRGLALQVLDEAFLNDALVVEEWEVEQDKEGNVAGKRLLSPRHLPLLGWSIAWPTPLSRDYRPQSHSLRSRAWEKLHLGEEAKERLGVKVPFSYAMNDAAAAAIAVAHEQTHQPDYNSWKNPHLAMVLRVAGGVGSASIIVEELFEDRHNKVLKKQSGFTKSILIAGIDKCAGEIGHIPIPEAFIQALNNERPDGLREITGVGCSCDRTKAPKEHLESFASARALRERIDPNSTMNEVLERVRTESSNKLLRRAMEDVGSVIGEALVGPVAALNPATVTLTGSMATEDVARALRSRLEVQRGVASLPNVRVLEGHENTFICARGAALALIRDQVHRNLSWLLGEDGDGNPEGEPNEFLAMERIRTLTFPYVPDAASTRTGANAQ